MASSGEVILQQHEDAVLEAVGDLQPVLGGEILPVPGEGADPVGRGEGRGPVLIHQQAEGRAGVPLLLRVGHAPQEHADHLVGAGQVLRRVGRSRDAAAACRAQSQNQRQDQDAGQKLVHGSVPLLYVLSLQYNGPAAFCQRIRPFPAFFRTAGVRGTCALPSPALQPPVSSRYVCHFFTAVFLFYILVTENRLLPKHLYFTIRLASRVFIFFILSSFHRKAERPKTLRFFYAPAPPNLPFSPRAGIVIPSKTCYNIDSVVSY